MFPCPGLSSIQITDEGGSKVLVKRSSGEETAESVKVKTANLVAIGEAAAARDAPGPLLGGYAEEYVWVQMDTPQPGGGTIESGFGLPPVSEGF